jgi:tetratricopeptide (TPR) repeat protein
MTLFEESIAAAAKAVARRDWATALGIWEVVTQQFPDRPEGFVGKGSALIELGRSTEAEQFLAEAMGRFPDNLWSAAAYAQLPERVRNWREALRRWEAVRDKFPDAAVGHVGVAAVLRELGEIDMAEAAFADAVKRFPDDVWAAHNHAEIAGRRDDWREALRRWESVIQRFPQHPGGYVGASAALRMLDRLEDADRLLSEADQAFPTHYWVAVDYARLAALQRRWDEAVRRWDRVLQRFPDDATGHVEKTAALIQAGRLREAEDFLKIARERFPGEPRLGGFGLEIAAQQRAAARADSGKWHRQIRDVLARLRAIAGEDHTLLLRTIYRDVLAFEPVSGPDTELLARSLAALGELLPERSAECVQLCEQLAVSDIERICVLSSALRRIRENTIWLHYNLTDSLNRLMLSGQTIARGPCLLHCFLALMRPTGGRENEPLPRSILARELAAFAPHDAIREGLEAMLLGQAAPYWSIQAATKQLNLLPDGSESPTEPDILYLKTIAQACGLPVMGGVQAIRRADAADISERTAFDPETRVRRVPRGDRIYFRDAGNPIELPAIRVYAISGGTVSFDLSRRGRTQFYIFDDRDFCISDLSLGATPFISEQRIDVRGPLGILDDLHSSAMSICHFLLDGLTRVPIYRQCHGGEAHFLLGADYPYYREILGLAGLEERIVRPGSTRFSVRAELLLVSSNLLEDFHHPAHLCARWALDFLRTQLQVRPAGRTRRKIFISRADAVGRNLINSSEVEGALRERGFDIVTLSGRNARDQIELFSSASHVVGVHGAGLTNVLFSPPGTRVLEVLPPLVATEAYWTLCSQLGHTYSCLIADDPEYPRPDYSTWLHRPEYDRRDIILPIEPLIGAVERMGG